MAADQSIPPNQSLFIQNLPEKFQKDDLRRSLYMLFSTYGPILDVTAMKGNKMRGQAHVLFRDVQSATQAMRACQGLEFFGRQMRIAYSKNRSDTLAKLTGTFGQPKETQEPQKQIAAPPAGFPAPPGKGGPPSSLPGPPSGLPPPPGLPSKTDGLAPPASKEVNAASPQGVKRQREEDSDGEDVKMDEDDDEGEMEMSDSD